MTNHQRRVARMWMLVLMFHTGFAAAVFGHYPFRYAIAPLFMQGFLAYYADRWLETQ